MSLWSRIKSTLLYYTVFFIIFAVAFFSLFTLRDVFVSLDTIIYFQLFNIFQIYKAFFCLALFGFLIYEVDRLSGVILNIIRVIKLDKKINKLGFSVTVDGEQGVGKTRTQVYIAIASIAKKYSDLKYNYYVDRPFEDELLEKFNNGEKLPFALYKAKKESVQVYDAEKDEYIPLLYGNIEVRLNGKKQRELPIECFTMQKRLYESNIKLLSEADDYFPNTIRKKNEVGEATSESNIIAKYASKDRQMTGGLLLTDTHRKGTLFISFKDCIDTAWHLTKNKYLYTPLLIKIIFLFFHHFVLKYGENSSKKLCLKAKKCERLLKKIGFTKIYYFSEYGAAGNKSISDEEEFYILPNEVPYQYNDRAYILDYYPHGYIDYPKIKTAYDLAIEKALTREAVKEKLKAEKSANKGSKIV